MSGTAAMSLGSRCGAIVFSLKRGVGVVVRVVMVVFVVVEGYVLVREEVMGVVIAVVGVVVRLSKIARNPAACTLLRSMPVAVIGPRCAGVVVVGSGVVVVGIAESPVHLHRCRPSQCFAQPLRSCASSVNSSNETVIGTSIQMLPGRFISYCVWTASLTSRGPAAHFVAGRLDF